MLRTVVLVLPPLNIVLRTDRLPVLVIVDMPVMRPFLFLRTIVLDIFLVQFKFVVAILAFHVYHSAIPGRIIDVPRPFARNGSHSESPRLISSIDIPTAFPMGCQPRAILSQWVAQGVSHMEDSYAVVT